MPTSFTCVRSGAGLFDPYCTEWNNTEVSEKVDFLGTLIVETGCRLLAMVELYKKMYIEKGQPHIARDADDGLIELLEWAILDRKRLEKLGGR